MPTFSTQTRQFITPDEQQQRRTDDILDVNVLFHVALDNILKAKHPQCKDEIAREAISAMRMILG